jgi:hypothetical protein
VYGPVQRVALGVLLVVAEKVIGVRLRHGSCSFAVWAGDETGMPVRPS